MFDQLDQIVVDTVRGAMKDIWSIAVVILASTARLVVSPLGIGLAVVFRAFTCSLLLGFVAHLLSLEYSLSDHMRVFGLICAAFFADDVLKGLATLGTAFGKDPFIIFTWLERLRARK